MVMGETVTIEGERFLGYFKASMRNGTGEGGSGYTAHTYDTYWYEGTGIILDKETREKYFFALDTKRFQEAFSPEKNYTLEESIVYFNQKGPFYAVDIQPKLVNGMYKKIIDLSLENLVAQVKVTLDDIPTAHPVLLKPENLVLQGLCAGKNGQMYLPF
jgi:hypothetical protein